MIKNAIVCMFDSLQFNYLGCYGNDWIKTPNFDRFSREGVQFDNFYIEGVPTIPARRAMHTGRYTLPVAGWVPLSMKDTTIADLCWGRPIDTALIFDCPMYRLPKFGYSRGFDKVYFQHGHEADEDYYGGDPLIHFDLEDYHEKSTYEIMEQKGFGRLVPVVEHETASYLKETQYWRGEKDQRCHRLMTHAIDYLEKIDRNKQFFLWVDCFDPHEPWDPPSALDKDLKCPYDPDYDGKNVILPAMVPVEGIYSERELHHIRMLYAEKVTCCDAALGRFMDAVRRLGLEENTLMIVVSDHGEPMGNGEHGHGIMRKCRPWPYEELVHAPMWMRAPGVTAGQHVKSFTQSVDIAPTVCDWLGIGVHPSMQGKSLLPILFGEKEKVRDFAIAGYCKYSWSIITEKFSYIHWIKKGDNNSDEITAEMYGVDTSNPDAKLGETAVSEALARHKANATTDGEDQWTCTPGSTAELHDNDELYDRAADPFQLNNIITDHPEEAKVLLRKLTLFMDDLKSD
ncbi:MAG: sulfatase [Mailhella sp.]|nr:sulfatase [Mailhella sp.]